MTKPGYILAIDEGTTGTTSLLINAEGQVVTKAYQEVHPLYPQPGWVEEDAEELFQKAVAGAKEAIQKASIAYLSSKRHRHHQPAGNHRRLGPSNWETGE